MSELNVKPILRQFLVSITGNDIMQTNNDNYDCIDSFIESDRFQVALKQANVIDTGGGQLTLPDVMARTSEADTASAVSRTGELHSLHIAAYMDIDKTTESLKDMLRYKKEAAEQMLRCSDEKMCEQLAQVIKHADQLIQTVLGMYVP